MNSRFTAGLLLAALVLALAPAATAQCAMCANAAQTQQAEARRALNLGIAALVLPVFFLVGGFVFLAYKRRNPPDDPSGELPGFTESTPPHAAVVKLPLDSASDDRPRSSV